MLLQGFNVTVTETFTSNPLPILYRTVRLCRSFGSNFDTRARYSSLDLSSASGSGSSLILFGSKSSRLNLCLRLSLVGVDIKNSSGGMLASFDFGWGGVRVMAKSISISIKKLKIVIRIKIMNAKE